jgi:hypothetical protein
MSPRVRPPDRRDRPQTARFWHGQVHHGEVRNEATHHPGGRSRVIGTADHHHPPTAHGWQQQLQSAAEEPVVVDEGDAHRVLRARGHRDSIRWFRWTCGVCPRPGIARQPAADDCVRPDVGGAMTVLPFTRNVPIQPRVRLRQRRFDVALAFVGVHVATVLLVWALLLALPVPLPAIWVVVAVLAAEGLGLTTAAAVRAKLLRRRTCATPPDVVLRVACHELRSPVAALRSLTCALTAPACAGEGHIRQEMADLAHEHSEHLHLMPGWLADAALAARPPDSAGDSHTRALADVVRSAACDVDTGHRLRVQVSAAASRSAVESLRTQRCSATCWRTRCGTAPLMARSSCAPCGTARACASR